MDTADISVRFRYHAPDNKKIGIHSQVRSRLEELAVEFNALIPDGREKSLAMTHLEEAMFWMNAAIARN
jgi:hypothetical protein